MRSLAFSFRVEQPKLGLSHTSAPSVPTTFFIELPIPMDPVTSNFSPNPLPKSPQGTSPRLRECRSKLSQTRSNTSASHAPNKTD